MAKKQYEEVVDRNVKNPPPPRDPALLEKVGENQYALSIFPVALNGSRKLRLRYLIPSSFQEGAHRCHFPFFSRMASVTLRGGNGLQGYALTSTRSDGTLTTVKNEEGITQPLSLDPDAYNQFQPYYWSSGNVSILRFVTPLFGENNGSRVYLGSMANASGF